MIVKGEEKLAGLHPDLVRVIRAASKMTDFVIVEGLRTIERQRALVAQGKSQTLNSRHIKANNGYGHAIDIYPYVDGKMIVDWGGGHFAALYKVVKAASFDENVPVEWGGSWRKFKDGPHWQLPWKQYPGDGAAQEVAAHAKMTKAGLEGNKPAGPSSRIVKGTVFGGTIAAGQVVEAVTKANDVWSAGTIISVIGGFLILAACAYALYARSDDGGSFPDAAPESGAASPQAGEG